MRVLKSEYIYLQDDENVKTSGFIFSTCLSLYSKQTHTFDYKPFVMFVSPLTEENKISASVAANCFTMFTMNVLH